jgi:hypothetical protein
MLTPLQKVIIKKEKGAKKVVKEKTKVKLFSSTPSTPLVLLKRPRAISSEVRVRKRSGAFIRALKALRDTAAEEDDGEQLEPLENLLRGSASAGEVGNGEV